MIDLLTSAILTSAVDCVNPIVITQHFVLQGMVKKTNHIWFFIIPTGLTNIVFGIMTYFGVGSFLNGFSKGLIKSYGHILFAAELIVGIIFLMSVGFILQRGKIKSMEKEMYYIKYGESGKDDDEEKALLKVKSVSPIALVLLGVGSTASELTTALPYFAFLAILINHKVSLINLFLILIFYNIIYISPSIALYFVYIKSKAKFDKLYTLIKTKFIKWSSVIVPAVFGVVGMLLVYHSITLMISNA